LAYNPGFIPLEYSATDVLSRDFILIGESDKRIGDCLENLYFKMHPTRTIACRRMTFINAEITEIYLDASTMTGITHANMLHQLCVGSPEADVNIVAAAMSCDSRTGSEYLAGVLPCKIPACPNADQAFISLATSLLANQLLSEPNDYLNSYQIERIVRLCDEIVKSYATDVPQINPKVCLLGLDCKIDTTISECSVAHVLADRLSNRFDVFGYNPSLLHLSSCIEGDSHLKLVNSIDELLLDDELYILLLTTASNSWAKMNFSSTRKETSHIIDCWRILNKEIEKTYKYIRVVCLEHDTSKNEIR
jgi:UDP-glucose 6-dehydrogenase